LPSFKGGLIVERGTMKVKVKRPLSDLEKEAKEFAKQYRNALDSTNICDVKLVLELCQQYVEIAGEPFERNLHGIKNEYAPHVYFIWVIIKHSFNVPYRRLENIMKDLLGKTPVFSCVCKMLKKKAKQLIQYCSNFLQFIKTHIKKQIQPYVISDETKLIADSTGISSKTKSLKRTITTIENRQEKLTKNFDKLHLIVSYRPWRFSEKEGKNEETGFTLIEGAVAEGPYSSDAEAACKILTEFKGMPKGCYFIGDAAYETTNLLQMLFKKDYIPCIQPQNRNARNKIIKKARREYRAKIYKYRGIIEQVFGWLTNGGDNIVREKLPSTRALAIFSKALKILIKQLLALRIAKDKILENR
jgi:hypothetical protein